MRHHIYHGVELWFFLNSLTIQKGKKIVLTKNTQKQCLSFLNRMLYLFFQIFNNTTFINWDNSKKSLPFAIFLVDVVPHTFDGYQD